MNFLVQQQPAFVKLNGELIDPTKPSVVLIHGAANSNRVWDSVVEKMSCSTHNILAIDLPGHGATFAEAKTCIEDYADWLINLLDNGAISHATLIGHSMGSLIALDCARRYPKRVTSLILIGTALPMPVADKVLALADDDVEAAYELVTRASFYLPKNADGTWPQPNEMMKNYRQGLNQNLPRTLANDMRACHQYAIDEATLSTIETPTLVVIGEKDRMTTLEAGLLVRQQLVNAKHATIPNVGHMMMLEAPASVAQFIVAHLDESYQPLFPQS
jgi:pimeloyl-ACP methyl ester carboxylesterase